jgi:hypothetical protein
MAMIVAGRLNDLEPNHFRTALVALVRYASGSALDSIGELFELPRRISKSFEESDRSYCSRLKGEIQKKPPSSDREQLVGISFRAVLHLDPRTTMAQNDLIRSAVRDVEEWILSKEVGETFTVNDICLALRLNKYVIDVGAPNRPLEEIRLWRAAEGGTRHGQELTTNYIMNPGERLVVEPSMPTPIDIRIGRS